MDTFYLFSRNAHFNFAYFNKKIIQVYGFTFYLFVILIFVQALFLEYFWKNESTKLTIVKKQEIKNELKILEQQLILIHKYPNNFEKALGKEGVLKFIDKILDKIIFKKIQLQNLENKNNNDE